MSVDINKIGCNSKPHFAILRELLSRPHENSVDRRWSDFTKFGNEWAYSIDTVGIISTVDLSLAAYSAVIHCSNDIVCAGYQPKDIGISLSINHEQINIEAIRSLIEQVELACNTIGAKLGKSHTIFSDEHWLTIVSIGQLCQSNQKTIKPGLSYDLILTKKLGAARAFVFNELHGQNSRLAAEARQSLMQSHVPALSVLTNSTEATTDVSGNGLAGTLHLISQKYSLAVDINYQDIMFLGENFGDTPFSCGAKNNREAFKSQISNVRSLPSTIEEILYSPEYSGPILLVLENNDTTQHLSDLKANGYSFAHKIGTATVSNQITIQIS